LLYSMIAPSLGSSSPLYVFCMIFAMPLPYKQLQREASTCKSRLAKTLQSAGRGQFQSYLWSERFASRLGFVVRRVAQREACSSANSERPRLQKSRSRAVRLITLSKSARCTSALTPESRCNQNQQDSTQKTNRDSWKASGSGTRD